MSVVLDGEAGLGKHLRIRRHRFDNGLTLISLAERAAPIVSYQTWFGVGSKHEEPGATGMAHLFEHLMFNQTKRLALGEFDRQIESIGGETNAATWVDWTYYRSSVPAGSLELIASLEAERMTDLVLEHEVVEAEREVVMNERLERVEDDVDGFASEEMFRRAFDVHPYHWPTIGWMRDIESLSIPQIRSFYEKYYAPDNATIVVVGDFEEEKLLDLIQRHYGDMPASGLVHPSVPAEPAQTGERRHEYQRPVSAPRLLRGYRAPGQRDTDWPTLLFTCQLLAGTASSPLHRRLVIEQELASSVWCELLPFADPSLVEIAASATPEHSLDEVEACIDEVIDELRAAPIAESEVNKVRNRVETEFWGGLLTVDGKAETLGHYQCVHGDFGKLFEVADALAQVDSVAVGEMLKRYFQRDRCTVIRIEDEGEDESDDEDDA